MWGKIMNLEKSFVLKQKPEKLEWDGSVTVEMIMESMVKEFPEFLMALAEENFIRGYRQAMDDIGVAVPKIRRRIGQKNA
jgi:hypothetical protein